MAISIPAQSRTLPPLDGDHRWWVLKSAARCSIGVETTSKKKILSTAISNSKSRLASSYSSQLINSFGTRNTRRKKSQQAWFPEGAVSGRPILQDQKSRSSAPIVDHAEYPITTSYGSLGGWLHYSAPVKHGN